MQRQKRFTLSLVVATIVILLAIFLHTTFAYFTSTGTKKGELQFAVLNVNILSSTDGNNFTSLDDSTFTTRYFKNVQPGSTINLNNLQVKNTSDISVYALVKLNIEVSATDIDTISYTEWYNLTGTRVETSNFSVNTTGATLLEKNGTSNFAIPFVLDGDRFGNAYQNATVKTTLSAYAVQSNLRDSDMYVDEAQYAAYFIIKDDVSYVSLPEDYTQVEYIESTGTQYIDTGFIPTQNTIISVDYQSNKLAGEAFTCLFGSQLSAGDNIRCYILFGANNNTQVNIPRASINYIGLGTNGTASNNASPTNYYTNSSRSVYTLDIPNKKVSIGEDAWDLSTVATETVRDCEYPLFLLTRNTAGVADNNCSKGYLYGFKIWDNGTLVRNMIPCYRNKDNKVGMYDMVNDVFYTNAGTGEFQYVETSSYSFTGKIYGNCYQDGTPSPTNPVEIQCVGEKTANLFDVSNSVGFYSNYAGLTNTINGNQIIVKCSVDTRSGYLLLGKFEPGTYTIYVGEHLAYKDDVASAISPSVYVSDELYGSAVSYMGKINEYLTITLSAEKYVYVYFAFSNSPDYYQFSNVMITKGSEQIPYEPYGYKVPVTLNDGTTQNIYIKEPLRKVVKSNGKTIADYIDFNTNTIVRYIDKFTLDPNAYYSIYKYKGSEQTETTGIRCTQSLGFVGYRNPGISNYSNRVGDYYGYNSMWIGVSNTYFYWTGVLDLLGFTTAAEFKEWLKTNEVVVYYVKPSKTVEPIETLPKLNIDLTTGRVYGETTQEYPHGKNLFNINSYGSASGYLSFHTLHLELGKTYTISSNLPLGWIQISQYPNANISFQYKASNIYKYTFRFTLPSNFKATNVTLLNLFLGISSTSLCTNKSQLDGYQIQIEEGDTATAYEPYAGHIPLPDTPVELVSLGEKTKNLFNIKANKYSGTATLVGKTDSAITLSGTSTYQSYNIALPTDGSELLGETITISAKCVQSGTGPIGGIRLQWFNGETGISGIWYLNKTMTAGETEGLLTATGVLTDVPDFETYPDAKLCVALYANTSGTADGSVNITYSNIQVEIGSTATDYEPYGYNIPVELSNGTITYVYLEEPLRKVGDYADYIDFENGTVVRNVYYTKLINLCSKVTTGQTWSSGTCRIQPALSPVPNYSIAPLSNSMRCLAGDLMTSPNWIIFSSKYGANVYFSSTAVGLDPTDASVSTTNGTAIKKYIEEHDIDICYVLATPTVQTITSSLADWGLKTETSVQTSIDWKVNKTSWFQTKYLTNIELNGYPLMKTGSVVDSLTTNSEGKAVLTRNVGTYVFTGDETFTLSNGEYVFSKSSIDGINSSSTDLKCSHFDLTSSTGTMMTFRVDSSSIYFNFDNGLGGIDGFKEYLKDRYSKGDPMVIAYPLQTSTTSTISPTKNLYSGEQTLTFETGMETNNTDGTIYIEGDDVLNCAGKTLVVSYKLRRYEDDGWTDSTYPPFVGYAFYDSSNQIIQDSQKVIYLDNYTMTSNDGSWTYLWFTIDVSDSDISKIAIQLAGGGTSTQYRHYDIKQIKVEVGTQPSL